jgi:hypothetical protein
MAQERPQPPNVELGQMGLLYDAIKREIDYVRADVKDLREDLRTEHRQHKLDTQLEQVAMTNMGERLTHLEQVDRDAEVTHAAYQQLRRRLIAIAVGTASFASCVAVFVPALLQALGG